jgi:hypothetical protein
MVCPKNLIRSFCSTLLLFFRTAGPHSTGRINGSDHWEGEVTVLRYIQTVLWSFIGLGRRQNFGEVTRAGNPLVLIAIALSLAAVFVLALVALAALAVGLAA